MEINKPINDNTSYTYLQLDNGLNVMICSNPKINVSSASLSVNVGSLNDNKEYLGMAHFLEHMLFMGSHTYPTENHFMTYVHGNGGSTNAYTDLNYTNYFFEIQNDLFLEGLDIFGHFFIDPLLSEENMQREINAVDSEHGKNKLNDDWRTMRLFELCLDSNNPRSMFHTGSLETLSKPGLYQKTLDFYNTRYSANVMNLAILTHLSYEDIIDNIKTIFSQITNTNYVPELIVSDIQISQSNKSWNEYNKYFAFEGIEEEYILNMIWTLPGIDSNYDYNLYSVIQEVLSTERTGGFYDFCRQNDFIYDFEIGFIENSKYQTSMMVQFELTDKGYKYKNIVIKKFYEYIDYLKNLGLTEEIYNTIKTITKNAFLFTEDSEGSDRVTDLTISMFEFPLKDVISECSLMRDYDHNVQILYLDYLNLLSPDRVNIILKTLDIQNPDIEHYYGIKYREIKTPFTDITLPKTNFRLKLRNRFIREQPTNISFKDSGPSLIYEKEGLKVFYSNSQKFGIPRGYISLYIKSNMFEDKKNYVLVQLYITTFLNQYANLLEEIQTAGNIVDIEYLFYDDMIMINMIGYNNVLYDIFKSVVYRFMTHEAKEIEFISAKDELMTEYKNYKFQMPYNLIFDKLNESIMNKFWDYESYLQLLPEINFSELINFNIQCIHIDTIIYGGVSEVNKIVGYLNSFRTCMYNKDTTYLYKRRIKKINNFNLDNLEDENKTALLFINYGNYNPLNDINITIFFNIFKMYIGNTFFNELRTKQQLGYIAKHNPIRLGTSIKRLEGYYFLVQSKNTGLREIYDRVKKFIDDIEDIDEDKFNEFKQVYYMNLIMPNINIFEEMSDINTEIILGRYDFMRNQHLIEGLERFTIDMFRQYMNKKKQNFIVSIGSI